MLLLECGDNRSLNKHELSLHIQDKYNRLLMNPKNLQTLCALISSKARVPRGLPQGGGVQGLHAERYKILWHRRRGGLERCQGGQQGLTCCVRQVSLLMNLKEAMISEPALLILGGLYEP